MIYPRRDAGNRQKCRVHTWAYSEPNECLLCGAKMPCAHGWDESLIESTPEGVICRRCGVEGAVYR